MGLLLRDGEIMNDPVRTVQIDRVRLTGLGVTPDRAERVRAMVEAALRRLLEQERWSDGLTGSELSRLDAPTMQVDVPHSNSHVANDLAQSIARALRSVE